MNQLKYEDEFCGLSTQKLDIEVLLQDAEAFENLFFPPANPMNINEAMYFDDLYAILNEGDVEGPVDEGGPSGSYMMVTNQMTNGDSVNVEPKPSNEQRVNKKWTTARRKRVQKGSTEEAIKKELNKIRNREAANRAYEQKKARDKWLEFEAQRYRKKNANMKRLIEFAESSIVSNMTRKQLRRTASYDVGLHEQLGLSNA